MSRCLRIAPTDNVAVALEPVAAGIRVAVEGASVTTREDIPQGHKLALTAIPAGADVIKYGCPGHPPGGRPGGNPQRALDRAHRGLR